MDTMLLFLSVALLFVSTYFTAFVWLMIQLWEQQVANRKIPTKYKLILYSGEGVCARPFVSGFGAKQRAIG